MKVKIAATLPLLIFLLFVTPSKAQDVILKKNGTKIEAKILSADSLIVVYYVYTDMAKTKYYLSTDYVAKVIYENGESLSFGNLHLTNRLDAVPYKRNIIQSSFYGLFGFGNINLRYERVTGTGNLSYFTGAAFTIKPDLFRYEKHDDHRYINTWGQAVVRSVFFFETGLNYYPWQKGVFRYGSGFSFLLTVYKAEIFEGWSDPNPEIGNVLTGRFGFNNLVRIYISETIQVYVAIDLSIIPNILENYIFQLGISYSF